jgi:hypothetical protein
MYGTVLKEANDPEDIDPITGVATISEDQETIHKPAVGAGANPNKRDTREQDPNIHCEKEHHTYSSTPEGEPYEGRTKNTSCPEYVYKGTKAWRRKGNSVMSINPLSVVESGKDLETELVIAKCVL